MTRPALRAQVCAWAGEREQAIAQLEGLVNRPRACHYGYLKMSPDWIDIRGESRFQRLVQSLAPARGQSRIIPVGEDCAIAAAGSDMRSHALGSKNILQRRAKFSERIGKQKLYENKIHFSRRTCPP